jgi:hypothetical protein
MAQVCDFSHFSHMISSEFAVENGHLLCKIAHIVLIFPLFRAAEKPHPDKVFPVFAEYLWKKRRRRSPSRSV